MPLQTLAPCPFLPVGPQLALKAAGVLSLLWACFHLAFPRLFRWDTALAPLDRINRSILRVLNLCLTFMFLLAAWLSLAFTGEMLGTALGRALCGGLAGFWLLRLGLQFSHFNGLAPRSLVLSALFSATAAAYLWPLLA